jgi:imidazolonepropionase-like amidohydrolase
MQLVLALLFAWVCGADPAVLCLDSLSLIDGKGGKPQDNMSILITASGIISDIFVTGSRTVPSVRHIDLTGRFVIPGLIDAHVHTSSEWPQDTTEMNELLAWALRGGLTNLRDMGGDAIFIQPFAQQAVIPVVASPRIHFSALIGGPAFFADPRCQQAAHGFVAGSVPWLRALIDETDNFALYAKEAWNLGATGIKVYGDLNESLIAPMARAASQVGLRTWAHAAVFPAKPSECLRAGIEVLSHSAYLVWEPVNPMPSDYRMRFSGNYSLYAFDDPAIVALLKTMATQGAILDATVYVFTEMNDTLTSDWTFNVTRLAHSLGVKIDAGTDDMGSPFDGDLYPNLHKEMELLVTRCGFTALEAIRAATLIAAQALSIDDSFGTLEKGKVADLVVLRSDPSQDITNTKDIEWVMKEGVIMH